MIEFTEIKHLRIVVELEVGKNLEDTTDLVID